MSNIQMHIKKSKITIPPAENNTNKNKEKRIITRTNLLYQIFVQLLCGKEENHLEFTFFQYKLPYAFIHIKLC